MSYDVCFVIISATSKKEAKKISAILLSKKLVAGTLIVKGLSNFWWKGRQEEQVYYNVQAFTLSSLKSKIIKEVKKVHSDEVPIIAFFEIDGNKEFVEWVQNSLK